MKKSTTLALAIGMLGSAGTFAMSSSPSVDEVAELQSSWVGEALEKQRRLDFNRPLSENSILGTHNTYNSEVYRSATRYLDPQQKHSIYDQLRLGARFIELDAHWTYKINGFDWGNDILLCHSSIGKNFGDVHVGCSLTDRPFRDGLAEVRTWLDENPDEVLIIMIEDHLEGQYDKLLSDLNSRLGDRMYQSGGGCHAIPADLTKADVLSAGKQAIVFKSGGTCSADSPVDPVVFTGLGSISRIWEDRTGVGALGEFFTGTAVSRIEAEDVVTEFASGRNIVNLDDMTHDDGRLEAAVWSWDVNQPNDWNGQDCGFQGADGRWGDDGCEFNFFFACENNSDGSWALSHYAGAWTDGAAACSALGDYSFSLPTNSADNAALKNAKGSVDQVWLNYNDRAVEGEWQSPGAQPLLNSTTFRELRDARSNLCLDVAGGDNNNGQNVRLWSCNGSDAQKWIYNASGQIKNVMGKCLDISGNDSNVHNGQSVQLWGCSTSAVDQSWNFSGGVLRNRVNSNIVMDAYGSNSGSDVGLWAHHGGDNQKWNWGN